MKKVKNQNSCHMYRVPCFKTGFTLIELLIVIGIIGILAAFLLSGLSGLRASSRDDRRVADLRQVQQALQLFHLKCGFYPGKYVQASNECKKNNPADWASLAKNLKNAEIGIESIPNDPVSGKNYKYKYWVNLADPRVKIAASQCYILMAKMETDHKSLKDPKKLDGNPPLNNLFPETPANCSGKSPNFAYCIGNIECREFFK